MNVGFNPRVFLFERLFRLLDGVLLEGFHAPATDAGRGRGPTAASYRVAMTQMTMEGAGVSEVLEEASCCRSGAWRTKKEADHNMFLAPFDLLVAVDSTVGANMARGPWAAYAAGSLSSTYA